MNISIGDFVRKVKGVNIGMSGLIVSVETNGAGNTLVDVLDESGKILTWPVQYIEVINKD